MDYSLVFQDQKLGSIGAVRDAIRTNGKRFACNSIRVAVAYASLAGCKTFEAACGAGNWSKATKRWLVSFDFGQTEPNALKYLKGSTKSEVRIPSRDILLSNKLVPRACFHPKTYVFERLQQGALAEIGAFIGSANLTRGGLLTNVEHGVSIAGTAKEMKALIADLNAWWDAAWADSDPLTDKALAQYIKLRKFTPLQDKDAASEVAAGADPTVVPADFAAAAAACRYFWIDTLVLYKNRGAGKAEIRWTAPVARESSSDSREPLCR